LINFALTALDGQKFGELGFGSPPHALLLAEVMAQTNSARHDGMLTRSMTYRALLDAYAQGIAGHPKNNRGTTHISTIDAEGNSASLTLSNGEGSGHLLPDTGVMLNNMLGEEDLNPHGFNKWACDLRVSSMMAPTLAENDHHLIAIGSGGSNRLRTAILQTLCNLIDFQMTPAQAVSAPRLHVEQGRLDLEPGWPAETVDAIRKAHPEFRQWSEKNLYFGGTHTVWWNGERFDGAGDPRRGGVFAVYPPVDGDDV
jgi:gamma-glutamyltranspeptidase/glutathione hydrolase